MERGDRAGGEGAARGFTLVETLAAIAIVGVLASLVLFGVQRARAAALRASCLNNLKQIGLGMQMYLQAEGVFPPINLGVRQASGTEIYSWNFSAAARMLPYLEQPGLFNAVNFQLRPLGGEGLAANQTAMTTTLSVLLCPSDARIEVPGYGRVGYRFCVGPTPMVGPDRHDPLWNSGPFTTSRTYRAADFADGLSSTVGVSERLQGDWTRGPFRRGGDYTEASPPLDEPDARADAAVAICSAAGGPEASADSRGGESWFLSGYGFTLYNHCATPNGRTPDCAFHFITDSLHGRSLREGVMSATSLHPGGVNALYMDGGVRFVRDSIHPAAWRALGTRSGGEPVPAD